MNLILQVRKIGDGSSCMCIKIIPDSRISLKALSKHYVLVSLVEFNPWFLILPKKLRFFDTNWSKNFISTESWNVYHIVSLLHYLLSLFPSIVCGMWSYLVPSHSFPTSKKTALPKIRKSLYRHLLKLEAGKGVK